ncbi:hypothetical protein P3X46_028871 [Hevea brasiliensis]|uniref:Protein kinase domain-containing protein n=1 Tax=Hevea brasiliensis TaxID=3981 RepID=A0ABQ9KRW1_HEVBR|nr:hypothetical protein P3X46_028871 [Hevea brasiliensis]
MELKGKVPRGIVNSTRLTALDLSKNNLSGHLPSDIAKILQFVTFLVLSSNNFNGEIPPGIADCLTGHIPQQLGSLTRIKTFSVASNMLFGPVPRFVNIYMLESLVTRMDFEELSMAANNFSKNKIIGIGKMGATYKATVSNGNWFLAIKRILDSQNFDNEFISEVVTLGKLKHPNIVRLLGFSSEEKEKLLVYKYEPNGNFMTNCIPWKVKIAVGLVRGLAWLHHNHYLPTAHLNISSKWVLLNPKFELIKFYSKICELDYVKKDVYSFAVALLELITGNEITEMNDSRNLEETFDICYGLDEVVDKSLIGQGFNDEIIRLLRIACECVQPLAR